LFFHCFASVQNFETYPPARGKNKEALKKQSCLCMFYGREKANKKNDLLHLSTKEMLKKEY
jgi:hypothetical protein